MSTPGHGTEIPIEFKVSGQEAVIAAAIKVQKETVEAWRKTLPEPKFIDHFEQTTEKMSDLAAKTARNIQVNWSAITKESQKAAQFVSDLDQKARLRSYGDIKKTGLGPAGIGITTIDRAVVSHRALKAGTDALAQSIRALPSIGAALGLSQLGLGVERIQALTRAIRALSAVGVGGAAAAVAPVALPVLGILAGLAPTVYAIWQMWETAETKAETMDSREENNLKLLANITKFVRERQQTGEIRDGGKEILKEAEQLIAEQINTKKDKTPIRNAMGVNIQSRSAALLKRASQLIQASFETEQTGARDHMEAMSELTRTRLEGEREVLQISLQSTLEDRELSQEAQIKAAESYASRMRGIALETANVEKEILDHRQVWLQGSAGRVVNDPDATRKIENELQGIADARLILEEKSKADLERIEAQHVARLDRIRTDHMEREIKETEDFLEEIERLVDAEEKAADRHEREMERILNAQQQDLMARYSAAGSDWSMSGPQQFRAQSAIVQSGYDEGILTDGDAAALQNRLGADPEDVNAQMVSAISDMQTQFGTVAQNIARSFRDVIGTAVQSVSRGLQSLIGDTEFWSQRLGNIAGPIMGAITASISEMFTTWIVQRGLAAAKNILFSTKEGAADAAAKAPGAMMSSISSWGIAAGVGVAAFLAAMALTGGFKGGGYTGDGGVSEFAGVVHGKEFVFDAPATQRLGRENLEALRSGRRSAAGGGNSPINITLANFDSRPSAEQYLNSVTGDAYLANAHEKISHRWRRA